MDSGECVSSQKVCITVDNQQESFRGWTEATCTVDRTATTIGLHAHSLFISKVVVDGYLVLHTERLPTINPIPDGWKACDVKEGAAKLAKLAHLQYNHLLEFEKQPNIVVEMPDLSSGDDEMETQQGGKRQIVVQVLFAATESSVLESCGGYTFCKASYWGSSNWYPRISLPDKQGDFHLEVAVHPKELAVCSGQLTGHEWSQDNKWKIFKYRIVPAPATNLFLAVGPFDLAPCVLDSGSPPRGLTTSTPRGSRRSTIVTHFSNHGTLAALQATTRFFPFIFSFFEELLGTGFPMPSVQSVFVPDFRTQHCSWHSCCILPGDALLPAKNSSTQSLESQLKIARGIARLWFGVVLMPKTSSDLWVIEGLLGWVEGRFITKIMGAHEWNYRLAKMRKSVCLGDDGFWPPLCVRHATGVSGAEWLGHEQQLQWKATSVMCMLERRVGQEVFRRVVERLMSRAAHAAQSNLCSSARFISSHSFLKEVGQSGGIRKEIHAFTERWIYGRGCPTLNASVSFDPKAFTVDVRLQQQGSSACRDSTVRAMNISKDGGIGAIKMMVAESAMTSEHTIRLGSRSVIEEKFKVQGRPRKKRRSEGEVLDEESQSPVKYVRVDPNGEWLAHLVVHQSEAMWCNMLEEIKDVVSESEAIDGLMSIQSLSMGIYNVLEKYLDSEAFCRVRMEAALALGHSSWEDNSAAGVSFLIKFLRARCYDPDLKLPKQNYFAELSEHMVNQSIPFALAISRNAEGFTPREAVDILLEVLDYNDNDGNEFCDSDWVGSFLEALGDVAVTNEAMLKSITDRFHRYLARDKLFPSPNGSVTQSCLRPWAALSLHQTTAYRKSLLAVLHSYFSLENHPRVRETARKCSLKVELSLCGPEHAVLSTISCPDSIPVVCGLLEECIQFLGRIGRKVRGKSGLGWEAIEKVYSRMTARRDWAFQHLVYTLLMAICGESTVVYRDKIQEVMTLEGRKPGLESKDPDALQLPAASSSQSPGLVKGGNLKVKIKLGSFSFRNSPG